MSGRGKKRFGGFLRLFSSVRLRSRSSSGHHRETLSSRSPRYSRDYRGWRNRVSPPWSGGSARRFAAIQVGEPADDVCRPRLSSTGCFHLPHNCRRSAPNIPKRKYFGSSNTASAEPACLPTESGIRTKKYGPCPLTLSESSHYPRASRKSWRSQRALLPASSPRRASLHKAKRTGAVASG
jgi:hypothetical protein